MCSQTDDPSQHAVCRAQGPVERCVLPGGHTDNQPLHQDAHGREWRGIRALTDAQLGLLGCDNAPSSMVGHSGRCGSLEEHRALLAQGIGIGKRYDESTADLIAGDHELIADEFHGRYPR